MKNLLIAAASVLFVLTMLLGWLRADQAVRAKQTLKYAADEAASAAALCIREEEFSEGRLEIDKEEAEKAAEKMILENLKDADETLRWEIVFLEEGEEPAVSVTIYDKRLKAVSVYEYLPL